MGYIFMQILVSLAVLCLKKYSIGTFLLTLYHLNLDFFMPPVLMDV